MISRATRRISIDRFLTLWNAVENQDWDAVAPNITEIIQEEWQHELRLMFNELKSHGSYGAISMEELFTFASNLTVPVKDLPYGGASNSRAAFKSARRYIRRYPQLYVKSGEMMRKMLSPYQFRPKRTLNVRGVKIRIPMKTGWEVENPLHPRQDAPEHIRNELGFPRHAFTRRGRRMGIYRSHYERQSGNASGSYDLKRTYMYLEQRRSYIKSSFLRAWPRILNRIIQTIAR